MQPYRAHKLPCRKFVLPIDIKVAITAVLYVVAWIALALVIQWISGHHGVQ